mgnify:CR=1 FL=1
MGAGLSANFQSNSTTQQATQNIMQSITTGCSPVCQNDISNVTREANNITGNIVFNQTCTLQGTCAISTASSSVAQIMFDQTQANQATTPFLFFGASLNVGTNDSVQQIESMISQQVNAICNPNSINTATNVSIIAKNSISGDIIFNQSGNTAVDCTIQATAASISNISGVSKQSNIAGVNLDAAILIIVIIVLIIIIIALIVSSSKNKKAARECNAKLSSQ